MSITKAGDLKSTDVGKSVRFPTAGIDVVGSVVSGELVGFTSSNRIRGNRVVPGVLLTINVGIDRRGYTFKNVHDEFGPLSLEHPIEILS